MSEFDNPSFIIGMVIGAIISLIIWIIVSEFQNKNSEIRELKKKISGKRGRKHEQPRIN